METSIRTIDPSTATSTCNLFVDNYVLWKNQLVGWLCMGKYAPAKQDTKKEVSMNDTKRFPSCVPVRVYNQLVDASADRFGFEPWAKGLDFKGPDGLVNENMYLHLSSNDFLQIFVADLILFGRALKRCGITVWDTPYCFLPLGQNRAWWVGKELAYCVNHCGDHMLLEFRYEIQPYFYNHSRCVAIKNY